MCCTRMDGWIVRNSDEPSSNKLQQSDGRDGAMVYHHGEDEREIFGIEANPKVAYETVSSLLGHVQAAHQGATRDAQDALLNSPLRHSELILQLPGLSFMHCIMHCIEHLMELYRPRWIARVLLSDPINYVSLSVHRRSVTVTTSRCKFILSMEISAKIRINMLKIVQTPTYACLLQGKKTQERKLLHQTLMYVSETRQKLKFAHQTPDASKFSQYDASKSGRPSAR